MILDEHFWTQRYENLEIGWDIGGISNPIKEFADTLTSYDLRILIHGAGNAYEAEYLFKKGFNHVFVVDIARPPLDSFIRRVPDFPSNQLIHVDFFQHHGKYDLIIEQTFFCAIDPSLRPAYATKMHELLVENGMLCGLLFDDPMNATSPPFGGSMDEYRTYFEPFFFFDKFQKCNNSILPRKGKEMWMELRRKG